MIPYPSVHEYNNNHSLPKWSLTTHGIFKKVHSYTNTHRLHPCRRKSKNSSSMKHWHRDIEVICHSCTYTCLQMEACTRKQHLGHTDVCVPAYIRQHVPASKLLHAGIETYRYNTSLMYIQKACTCKHSICWPHMCMCTCIHVTACMQVLH